MNHVLIAEKQRLKQKKVKLYICVTHYIHWGKITPVYIVIAYVLICSLLLLRFSYRRLNKHKFDTLDYLFLVLSLVGVLWIVLKKNDLFHTAEAMGNSSSKGAYSPGHNTEESSIKSTKTLNTNLEKYPVTAKKDKEQIWSSTVEIAKAGAKGCVTGASITSIYNKDYRACIAGASLGGAWYTKDAVITQLSQNLDRGLPIEQTIKMERQRGTNFSNEETKKDE